MKNILAYIRIRGGFIALGPILFCVFSYFLPFEGMTATSKYTLGITAWMATWWISEVIAIQATALLPLILFPFLGILDLKSAAAPYAHPFIFLFLGGFMLALAIEKWDLHKRIALKIISIFGTKPSQLIGGVMAATAFLSMWISNTATAVMMLPIALSLIRSLALSENSKFAESMLLGVAYSASIGGIATLIGTPPNLVFASFMEQKMHRVISFMTWMSWAFPLALTILICTWYLLTRSLKREVSESHLSNIQLEKLKPMKSEEKKVLWVFSLTALAWIFRSTLIEPLFPNIDDTLIALIAALILFTLNSSTGKPLIEWKDTQKLSWGSLILFGGGLSLAAAFDKSGLATWMTEWISTWNNLHPALIVLLVLVFMNFLTELTSNLAATVVVLPLLLPISISMGIDPYYFLAGTAISASAAFMLPVATPPNTLVFSSGHIRINRMIKVGLKLNLLSIIIVFAFVEFLMWINQFGNN